MMVMVRLIGNQVIGGGVYFSGTVLMMDELDAALAVRLGKVEEIEAAETPRGETKKAAKTKAASVRQDAGSIEDVEVSDG